MTTTHESFELVIDGQGHRLVDGWLYCDLFPEVGLHPEDTCRLRVEHCTDDAIEALTRGGFEFDDCRATEKVRLGDIGTGHVWFAGVGQPAGCDLIAEEGEPLDLPSENWWDLMGTVEGGKWNWDGEGSPFDWEGNTVQKIVAFVAAN